MVISKWQGRGQDSGGFGGQSRGTGVLPLLEAFEVALEYLMVLYNTSIWRESYQPSPL